MPALDVLDQVSVASVALDALSCIGECAGGADGWHVGSMDVEGDMFNPMVICSIQWYLLCRRGAKPERLSRAKSERQSHVSGMKLCRSLPVSHALPAEGVKWFLLLGPYILSCSPPHSALSSTEHEAHPPLWEEIS